MKIKCQACGARVYILDGGKVVHRSGGQACSFPLVYAGHRIEKQVTLGDLVHLQEAKASQRSDDVLP